MSKLVIVETKITDIMSVIHSLSDDALVSHITLAVDGFITDTDIRFRQFSVDLQPYFMEFWSRFKDEKKAGRPYLGFTNFERACDQKLHYCAKQVRRIANGQPTPTKSTKPVNHLTPAAKLARKLKAERNAKLDAAADQHQEEVDESNDESQALMNVPYPEPVPYGDILAAADKLASAVLNGDDDIVGLAKIYLAMRPTRTPTPTKPAKVVANLGTCEACYHAPATVRTGGYLSSNYCDKCAADDREYDRKALIRKMGVAKVINRFWSWKSLPNEPKTMDDGEGGQGSLYSKRQYIAMLKEEFLGNTEYNQTWVAEYVAAVEAKFAAL